MAARRESCCRSSTNPGILAAAVPCLPPVWCAAAAMVAPITRSRSRSRSRCCCCCCCWVPRRQKPQEKGKEFPHHTNHPAAVYCCCCCCFCCCVGCCLEGAPLPARKPQRGDPHSDGPLPVCCCCREPPGCSGCLSLCCCCCCSLQHY